jgi:hypothetical protein
MASSGEPPNAPGDPPRRDGEPPGPTPGGDRESHDSARLDDDSVAAGPEADLTPLLRSWPTGASRPTVRMIRTADGSRAVQVRLELGILQMALDGRPDGLRPRGAASWLDFQLARLEQHREQAGSTDGFELTPKECEALRDEGVQVYHRYVALFALDEYEAVVRDAGRNLRMFDLCRDHGASHADRTVLEQYRPFVLMMRARAQAAIGLATGDSRAALAAVDAALAELSAHFEAHGPHDGFERSAEANLLRGMRAALVPSLPASQRAELEERLQRAVEAENFELAAILRDEIRSLEA